MQKFLTRTDMARILADMKPLCALLTEWRAMLKLTPADAARRCEMSPQLWYQLESGETANPRSRTLQRLALGTGIPLERLVAASCVTPASVPA